MIRQPTTGENVAFAVVFLFCLMMAGMIGYSVDQVTSKMADRVATATHLRNF